LLKEFEYELKEINEVICGTNHRAMLLVVPIQALGNGHCPINDQHHDGSKLMQHHDGSTLMILKIVSITKLNIRNCAKIKVASSVPQNCGPRLGQGKH